VAAGDTAAVADVAHGTTTPAVRRTAPQFVTLDDRVDQSSPPGTITMDTSR
jgi:hypothetical protein